jgi:hypothetical protein
MPAAAAGKLIVVATAPLGADAGSMASAPIATTTMIRCGENAPDREGGQLADSLPLG